MKKISPTITSLVILIGIAVVLVVVYIYLFLSLTKLGEKQRDFAGDIQNANQIITEESANKEKLTSYFVNDGEQAFFVSALESQCRKLSLKCFVQSLTETDDTANPVKVLDVSITSEGSLDGVTMLLSSFEKSSYPIEIKRSSLVSKVIAGTTASSSSRVVWVETTDLSVPVLINK